MKSILISILLYINVNAFGQACDTVNGNLINCIDSSGLRQGYWELTKDKIISSEYAGLGSSIGCTHIIKSAKIPFASGYYINGRKTGTWNLYSGDNCSIKVEEVTYYNNGSIKIINFLDKFSMEINKDTSIVTGMLNQSLDNISLDCKSGTCVFKLSNGQELFSSPYSNLSDIEYEITRLIIGVYNRDIKIKEGAR